MVEKVPAVKGEVQTGKKNKQNDAKFSLKVKSVRFCDHHL